MTNGSAQDLDLDLAGEDGERPAPSPVDWALLLLCAPKRRKVLFTAVLVAGLAGVILFYRSRTPIYRVEAKVLAQQQQVLPSSLRVGANDDPARTAWELIHRRDNLLALLGNAKLLDAQHSPGFLERLSNRLGVETTPADPSDVLVNILDKRLEVVTTEDGTITISLDWPNPQQAYAIVEGALQHFIEARHVQEVTAVDEVISVLRARAATARDQLDRVSREGRRPSRQAYRDDPAPAATPAGALEGASPEVIRLGSLLESKERAIQDVEEFRRRRLADLHAQLDAARATFSEAHPSIIQLRQDIDALSAESPQLAKLQGEAARLRAEYEAQRAQENRASAAAAAGAPRPRAQQPQGPLEEDERVLDARFQYQQIIERVNAAQLELDALRAAFKYRYNVVWPPQIPKEPISPNPLKLLGAGSVAILMLAFLAALLPDLKSGRIVERWQVERGLGIPVLGETEKKSSR